MRNRPTDFGNKRVHRRLERAGSFSFFREVFKVAIPLSLAALLVVFIGSLLIPRNEPVLQEVRLGDPDGDIRLPDNAWVTDTIDASDPRYIMWQQRTRSKKLIPDDWKR